MKNSDLQKLLIKHDPEMEVLFAFYGDTMEFDPDFKVELNKDKLIISL